MVKKLRCDVVPSDWVRIVKYAEDIAVQVNVSGEKTDIFLTLSDAKKLLKQIKKALIEIEGEGEPDADIPDEKEKPAYIPYVGEVVEVYQDTEDHLFQAGEKVRIKDINAAGDFVAENLDKSDFGFVKTDIRPIQNWKPKAGEKVLIVNSTFSPSPGSKNFIGKFGYIKGFARAILVDNEDKSDWFGFNLSDLRPAE